MPTYMFFRELQNTVSIKKQEEYADQHGIPKYQRLGQNQYGRETCTDIIELINRPLIAGDELIVYNLFTIGTNRPRIYEVLQAYHKAQIQLHILDINYFDKVQIGLPLKTENDHFKLYSSILKVFMNAFASSSVNEVFEPPANDHIPSAQPVVFTSLPSPILESFVRVFCMILASADAFTVYENAASESAVSIDTNALLPCDSFNALANSPFSGMTISHVS